MFPFAKKLGILMLTATTAIAPLTVTTAQAGERNWQRHQSRQVDDRSHHYNDRKYSKQQQRRHQQRPVNRQHRDNNNDDVVLGIIGLGVGAIIGGAIANSNNNNPRVIYQQPRVRDHVQSASGGRYEPWSNSWLRYCSDKYRSFNASTGTYRGYDGTDHFCVVN
ncbi:BA14K family protein [Hoeflea sp.]|uniref:BA14K family protein n=1 Tax=Hoeflea sp. TaxID=1940281 RepID=UPI002AFF76EB|nr:BA14K family protein [Hoeflea sp.]